MGDSGQGALIATLGIAPGTRARLSRAGFVTVADVVELQPSDLACGGFVIYILVCDLIKGICVMT